MIHVRPLSNDAPFSYLKPYQWLFTEPSGFCLLLSHDVCENSSALGNCWKLKGKP